MRFAIASGKGGTGKTTVAVNLAIVACRAGRDVHLCDCDVEEPNAHLFLEPDFDLVRPVILPVPEVDPVLCAHCGKCGAFCEFNAIACLPDRTTIFPDLCHSCSGCWLVCPQDAITPVPKTIGEVASGLAGGLTFTMGRLEIGETLVPPLIKAVMDQADEDSWVILDAPPGTTCPVVETLQDADYVVLVTEPTPFGLHDLVLALELTRKLGLPSGVVINRAETHEGLVEEYCAAEGVEILARIPFSRRVAESCAEGGLAIESDAEVAAAMTGLFRSLQSLEVST